MIESVEKRLLGSAVVCPDRGCWLWTRSTTSNGYGQTSWVDPEGRRRNVRTHRLAAALWLGFDIDSDLLVLHRCDVRTCFNPSHLFVGTALDNTQDMIAKGRANLIHRGESSGMAKLNDRSVREIRRLRSAGQTVRAIASRFGISHQSVSDICRRRSWAHVE